MKHILAFALMGSLFTAATHAAVLITFEVKAVHTGLTGSSSPDVVISTDGSHVGMYDGQVVLQLIAVINALNGDLTDDSFTRTNGSWVTVQTSSNLTGFLRGDALTFAGINNVDPFRGTGSKSGSQAELSGTIPGNGNDNIGDIGGTSSTTLDGYFVAASTSPIGTVGQSFLIGETILDVTGAIGFITVRYIPRITPNTGLISNRTNIRFRRDGTEYLLNGDGTSAVVGGQSADPDGLQYRSVTIQSVPEPSTFSMAVPGLIALAGFRRRRA